MEGKELQDMGRKVMKMPMMAPPFFRFSTPAPETSLTPKSLFRYADGMNDSLSEGIFNGQEVSKTILLPWTRHRHNLGKAFSSNIFGANLAPTAA
jgi:hypothetical protein